MVRQDLEPVEIVRGRRDAALQKLVAAIPYIRHLGVSFDRRGDELTAHLHYSDKLIGFPSPPALHGGAIGAFLEIAAIIELSWTLAWEKNQGMEHVDFEGLPTLPKTIDFTVDFLRAGLPRDAFARARINRSGRRYASVHVEAWQDNRARLFAQATGHFLMPSSNA